jgi:hypothetical protein
VFAVVLAGVAMLIIATPLSAAVRAKKTAPGTAQEPKCVRKVSQRINRGGTSYRKPPDCAYPVSYDSEGVAIFNTIGCRMP